MSVVTDASSFAATVIRAARGLYPQVTRDQRAESEQLLELYDFEACPYCRKVREALCELDLDYVEHPVAQGSARREELRRLGGKVQVPYLIDPNTGTRLYESDDIIAYLNETYGNGKRAGWRLPLPHIVDDLNSFLASAVRLGHGRACQATSPRKGIKRLVLYNMEGSPYCRKVREVLCELDLVYVARNVPKGSPMRDELRRLGGKVQVPYLIDPNTERSMYESDDIIAYLHEEYGAGVRRQAARARSRRKGKSSTAA